MLAKHKHRALPVALAAFAALLMVAPAAMAAPAIYRGSSSDGEIVFFETEEAEGAGIALSNIGANTYTIESFSSNGHEFDIVNNNGTLTYPCEPSGEGGCPSGAAGWGG